MQSGAILGSDPHFLPLPLPIPHLRRACHLFAGIRWRVGAVDEEGSVGAVEEDGCPKIDD